MAGAVADEIAPDEQLRRNVRELMHARRMNQTQFAALMRRSQSWVSKRQSGKPSPNGTPWKIEDLADLARVFGLSVWELLKPGIGRQDRRRYGDRRRLERRQYDPPPPRNDDELQEQANRLHGPPKDSRLT